MRIETVNFNVSSNGKSDIIDVTADVQKILSKSGLIEGSALVFVPGATAGVTTIEYEPGLLKDYPEFFEKLVPSDKTYCHDETWQDANGYAHIRAALQGASFTVPFSTGKLLLGTWQQIVVIDFDNRPRKRNVIVQLTGQ